MSSHDVPDVVAAEQLSHALVERAELGLVEGVRQAEHRTGVLHRREPFEGGAPTRWVGDSGVTSSGCFASRSWSSRMSASYASSAIVG